MTPNKTIKFFISSTFKDFEGERNILQKFVFPKLKDLCHENGFGFQPIDLRWGVKEEAGYDQQTMNICLNEIKRSSSEPSPNLLLLVGQRYGWVPIPYDIDENVFKKIIGSKELTEDEKVIVKTWYKEDQNYINTKYILKDKWQYKDNRNAWGEIENVLRDAFQKVIDKSFGDDIYNKFHTSATEQEMYEGLDAFDKNVDHRHTYAYFRELNNYDINNKEVEDYIDITISEDGQKVLNLEKLNYLKDRLQNKCNIPDKNQLNGDNKYKVDWSEIEDAKKIEYQDLTLENAPKYLRKFHDDILEKFIASITKEIKNFKEQTKLEIELDQQKLFLQKKSEVVLGRYSEVQNIKDFIDTSDQQYYLQYGRSGTGKTSVIAKAISKVDNTKYEVIYRFIGTTAMSTYSRHMFESILWEIESKIQNNEKLPSPIFEYEDDKFKKQFIKKLEEYQHNTNKSLIIFLDAVDQLEDKNDLKILLDELPQNIKVVFSCLYDESKKENEDYYWYYERLKNINSKNELKVLSDRDGIDYKDIMINILEQWLGRINRQISVDQKVHIKTLLNKNTTPLYLRLVYEIVKHWRHDQKDLELKKDEKDLTYQFFDFIVDKYHHENILLEETLGLISASKDGLSEEELIDLFSRDKRFLRTFQNHRYPELDRLPTAIWSRFYYYIQDIFTERLIDDEMLINPYHRVIEEAIKEKYYDDKFHSKLANYFHSRVNEAPVARNYKEVLHANNMLNNDDKVEYYLYDLKQYKFDNEFFIWGEEYFSIEDTSNLNELVDEIIIKEANRNFREEEYKEEYRLIGFIVHIINSNNNRFGDFIVEGIQKNAKYKIENNSIEIIDLLIKLYDTRENKYYDLGFEMKNVRNKNNVGQIVNSVIEQSKKYKKITNAIFYNILLCKKIIFMKLDNERTQVFSVLRLVNECV